MNFVIIGYGGYIASRHIKAVEDINGNIVCAFDIKDPTNKDFRSMPNTNFFSDYEAFTSFIEDSQKKTNLDYAIICSPNHLHYKHIVDCLNLDLNVICEKPLVGSSAEVILLKELEVKRKKRVFPILQLRYHDSILKLKSVFSRLTPDNCADVELTYIAGRDKSYLKSWKGDIKKSFGIEANIGIHFFDMLEWVFGELEHSDLFMYKPNKSSGFFKFKNAKAKWFLSIDVEDIPDLLKNDLTTYRSIKVNNNEIDFSSKDGFLDLHSVAYKEILAGRGLTLDDAMASIAILERIGSSKISKLNPVKTHKYIN